MRVKEKESVSVCLTVCACVCLCLCVSVCVFLCVFRTAWGHVLQTLKNVWRTQPCFFLDRAKGEQTVPGTPGENTVQIVWGRRELRSERKAVCSSGLQGNSSPESQVSVAQREMNLRYQFAEFCSIDGRVPRDLEPECTEAKTSKQNYLRKGTYSCSVFFHAWRRHSLCLFRAAVQLVFHASAGR